MFARSTLAVALLASAVVVVAQTDNTTIDPTTIDLTTRAQWCSAEHNTCGTLCSGAVKVNTCNQTDLTWNCTCTANDSSPGLEYYTSTMPTFICEAVFAACEQTNAGVAAAQEVCESNEKANCGHLDPTNFTAVSTSSSSSSSATAAATAASSSAASSSSSKAAAATMAAVANYAGPGAVAMGVAAAFGYML